MATTRAEILARHDLRDLLDRYVGPGRGRGRMATWPCPDPAHGPQTGRTPPVTVFDARNGDQRWKCHGCGAGGTAIDLVCIVTGGSVRDAFETLSACVPNPQAHRSLLPALVPSPEKAGSACIEGWVEASERRLWEPPGERARSWLAGRGLAEPVIRANRLGYNPGDTRQARIPGLPGIAGVVLPVLDRDGVAVYAQLRSLGYPPGPKYLNPSGLLAAAPAFAAVRPPAPPQTRQVVFVCEGIIDALTVAQAGWRACALLGAATAGRAAARAIARAYPGRNIVLALDNDEPGRAGSDRLLSTLTSLGLDQQISAVVLPQGSTDLNDWLTTLGTKHIEEGLTASIGHCAQPPTTNVSPDL